MSEIAVCILFLTAVGFPFIALFGAFGVGFIGHQFQWWRK